MMGPTLFPKAGVTSGPPYDDTAIVQRVATAEGDIGTLKSGKATTQSVATAKARADDAYDLAGSAKTVADALQAIHTNTLQPGTTIFTVGTGKQFASPMAAMTFGLTVRRWPGARMRCRVDNPLASVVFTENWTIPSGSDLGFMSFENTNVIGTDSAIDGYTILDNTTLNKRIGISVQPAVSAQFQVGDILFARRTSYGTGAAGDVVGSHVVTAVEPGLITVRNTTTRNISVVQQANVRIHRPPVQIRFSQTCVLDNVVMPSVTGFAFRSTAEPTGSAAYPLFRLTGATRWVLPTLVGPITRPSMFLSAATHGLVMTGTSLVLGNVCASNMNNVGVNMLIGTPLLAGVGLMATNCYGGGLWAADGAVVSMVDESGGKSTVVSGCNDTSILAARGSEIKLQGVDAYGATTDIYAGSVSYIALTTAFYGTTSPSINTFGNSGSFIAA